LLFNNPEQAENLKRHAVPFPHNRKEINSMFGSLKCLQQHHDVFMMTERTAEMQGARRAAGGVD
ncbi:hypothetical protein, partial [Erwinia psidii]|uniref:hypothetical protein n=1 Tax=Erwinia psidii TaxID=69224 RepID=UPI00226B30D8